MYVIELVSTQYTIMYMNFNSNDCVHCIYCMVSLLIGVYANDCINESRSFCVFCRCHDVTIGRQFYLSLKGVRNSLGYQFRFEVIFDDGSHLLSVSDHFARRIPQSGCGQDGHMTCYRELEGIPCVLVLAGEARAGLAFPR